LPGIASVDGHALRQQEFDRAAGRFSPVQPGREDPGVIQNEQRARPQLSQNIPESQVLARTTAAIHDEQAGVVAGIRRSGGNAVRRQEELVVDGLQASCSLQSTLQNFVSR